MIGAVALGAAIEGLESIGWDAIIAHEDELATRLRHGLAAIDGVRLLGPPRSWSCWPGSTAARRLVFSSEARSDESISTAITRLL